MHFFFPLKHNDWYVKRQGDLESPYHVNKNYEEKKERNTFLFFPLGVLEVEAATPSGEISEEERIEVSVWLAFILLTVNIRLDLFAIFY